MMCGRLRGLEKAGKESRETGRLNVDVMKHD